MSTVEFRQRWEIKHADDLRTLGFDALITGFRVIRAHKGSPLSAKAGWGHVEGPPGQRFPNGGAVAIANDGIQIRAPRYPVTIELVGRKGKS